MPSPPITLDFEKSTFLDNATFGEVINPKCLTALINSDLLNENYDPDNYSSKLASQFYKNEKEQLQTYLKKYNKKELVINVCYGLPRHKLGRVSPYKSLGLTGFSKRVRNTLIKEHYVDLDLSNAQPYILYNICNTNGLEKDCFFLEKLINNREEILQNVMTSYNVSRKKAKQLFLRLAFYGTFYGWCEENGLDTNLKPNDFIVGLTTELLSIANKIKIKNKSLFEKVRKITQNKENVLGSFMAFYLQTYERHILSVMCEFLCNETNLCDVSTSNTKILTYEYDGIKLLKEGVMTYGIDKLCRDLETVVKESIGFTIVLEEKPIDEFYELVFENTLDEEFDKNSYEYIKKEFELQHFKIINQVLFIKEKDNKFNFFKKEDLKTSYEHLTYDENIYDKDGSIKNVKKKSFISEWLKDANMLMYEDMKVLPPPLNCPENIYNLWRPFAMEFVDLNINKFVLDGLDAILDHILLLCGFDYDVYDYFIKWLAQMVQFPAIKTICIILISSEGAGKGTLMKLLFKMFGNDICLETTDPLRDVFGSFNELMVGKFFVNLNEVSKKDTTDVIGKMKGLITDENLTINSKGIKKINIASYHRFIMTTNSEDPIITKKDDRRNLIIRSSDKRCGDTEYFNLMNKYIDDVNVIKMFYEYLKSIPNMCDFSSIKKPITSYQEALQNQSISPIEKWLEHFATKYHHKDKMEMIGKETYDEFHNWCIDNNIKYECNTTSLLTKICLLVSSGKITGISKGRKTNRGNTQIFDITELKKHFGIGSLVAFKSEINTDNEDED